MAQIHDAADCGDLSLVRSLLAAGVDANAPAEDGWPPLNIACLNGHAAVAECLINAGADTNAASPGGFRPLFNAAQGGHMATVKLLVVSGAELDARSDDGGTALYNAALNGHADVVDFLIAAGAEVDAEASNGGTPLGVAAEGGHLPVVQILMDKGANVATANRDGFTPLHMAAQNGHKEVASFLLEHGADVDTSNNAGSTADDIAHLHGHPELVELIAGKRVQKPGGGTYCSKCGRGVIMSWTCPKCGKLFCDTCSGLTTSSPEIDQGFTVQTLGGGTPTCPSCETGVAPPSDEVLALVREGRKIQAIKLYRERTGVGLREAKGAVEALQSGQPLPAPQAPSGDLVQDTIECLRRDGKIQAIKLWRERTGQGLRESKESVEEIVRSHNVQVNAASESSGCFIATAACGAGSHEVAVLRQYRDSILNSTSVGRCAVAAYSVLSPPLAYVLERFSPLRRLTALAIVRPLARLVGKRHHLAGHQILA